MKHLYSEDYPYCCKISIIGRFRGNPSECDETLSDENIEKDLREAERMGYPILIAAINWEQREQMEPIFKKLKWKCKQTTDTVDIYIKECELDLEENDDDYF